MSQKQKNKTLSDVITGFDPISLEQLNNSMALMERKESKFLITEDKLPELIALLKEGYRVLTINDLHIFSYDNVYMDTNDYMFYHQHQGGSKIRTKVRTRQYVDSELHFFEYKQRNHGQITKYRYQMTEKEHGKITLEGVRFFQGIYESIYNEKLTKLIIPSLRNTYKRMTFCSKNNDERITIDFNVQFYDPINANHTHPMSNIAIIESKAAAQPAPSADIFDKLGIEKQGACSKYCLGLNYLGKVSEHSHFSDTLERIKSLQKQAISISHVMVNEAVQESFSNVS